MKFNPQFARDNPAIRLLIFDLDGTLIDSKIDLARSVNATLAWLGRKPLDDETIYSYVGEGSKKLIERAIGDGVTPQEVTEGLEFFIRYYSEHKLDHTAPYPGVPEALQRLAGNGNGEGRVLTVLTNKPVRVSREILRDLGLLPLFVAVYGGNSLETKKPDPAGAYRLLAETGIPPAEAMIIGDSDVDIITGRNAGIWTCGVTYGFGNLALETNPPDLVVDGLLELANALPIASSLSPSTFPH